MTAREEILGRIRAALASPGQQAGPDEQAGPAIPRSYRVTAGLDGGQLTGRLAGRLRDYGSMVTQVTPGEVQAAVAGALAGRDARRVIVPPGLDVPGLDLAGLAGVEVTVDDGCPVEVLAAADGVITGAALAIAETGTIILDGSPGQGRRALSLIPDYHLCLLHAGQIVGLVPEALAQLAPQRPLTWISGPSATSDIELDRVEGVHGPRTLAVIVIGDV